MNEVTTSVLVPVQHEARILLRSAARTVLQGTGIHLGVSSKWLMKKVEQLGLKEDEICTLLEVRSEYRGSLSHAVALLEKGYSVEQVLGCYDVRECLKHEEMSASIKRIATFAEAFRLEFSEDNAAMAQCIKWVHQVVTERYDFIQYPDETIKLLCSASRWSGCEFVESALIFVDRKLAKLDGIMSDDEDDDDY